MQKFVFNIIGIVILISVVIVALYFSFNKLTKKSFYEESGTKKVSGLTDKVEIVKDNFGVPHITANNEEDLYFTLGYTHAQDRLWQMDLTRRVAEGRLAEILGKDAVDYDILFRTIGIGKFSYSLYQNLSPKSKEILINYSKGVNAFIKEFNKKLPLEFDVLNYKPEDWKPEHSIMVIRMMGWELNISWMTEFMFGEIVNKFGVEKAKDLFPNYPEDAPYIVNNNKDSKSKNSKAEIIPDIEKYYSKLSSLGSNFYNNVLNYRDKFGIIGTHIGSNSWAVNGSKTEKGKPIIANDPHLVLQAPSRWYEIVMLNKKDAATVSGFSIPGTPGIAIGTNGNISWGITNLMNDDSDFLILQRDSVNHNNYYYKNNSIPIDSTEEYIKIKDEKDEILLVSYQTKFGPVISNLPKTGFMQNSNFNIGDKYIMTFKWTGFEFSDEIKCFYDIYHSADWTSFRNSLKTFGLPASNFTYADKNGNIGYQSAGKVPIRKNDENTNASIPNNFEIEWSGFINFDEMPNIYNPPDGIIVSANNKPLKDYKHYISNLYEPPYRAMRIEDVLKTKNNISSQEFKLLQNDYVSLQAKDFFKYVFDAFKDTTKISDYEYKLINSLKRWDYDANKLNGFTSLFAEFELSLYKNLYKNLLGEKLFKEYLFVNNVPIRNTSKLLKENSSWIFGNENDSLKQSSRNDIIKKSFREAIEECKKKFGTDSFDKWEWGKLHKVVIRHPLGIIPALEKYLNIGPYDIGGIGTTVANTEYSFVKAYETNEYECFIGASTRFIYDFNETKFYYTILPSGQSGQSQHPNYSDQTRLWLNSEYKKVYINTDDLKNNSADYKIMILNP